MKASKARKLKRAFLVLKPDSFIERAFHKVEIRMMEIDEHYCDVIIQRWENFTGKKQS